MQPVTDTSTTRPIRGNAFFFFLSFSPREGTMQANAGVAPLSFFALKDLHAMCSCAQATQISNVTGNYSQDSQEERDRQRKGERHTHRVTRYFLGIFKRWGRRGEERERRERERETKKRERERERERERHWHWHMVYCEGHRPIHKVGIGGWEVGEGVNVY